MPAAATANQAAIACIVTLPAGTAVHVRCVDMFGYCGRELHPEREDKGEFGTVVSAEPFEDDNSESGVSVAYTVDLYNGRRREFMDFEIAPV